jgi:hypothetical protein
VQSEQGTSGKPADHGAELSACGGSGVESLCARRRSRPLNLTFSGLMPKNPIKIEIIQEGESAFF